jgi:catechol 2,3-dioxygenase-like lactoylglutathione lyase family enzyme
MLDHIFLSVSNIERSIRFYEAALVPLGITVRLDYDDKDGPPGHPDLKGFGAHGRMFFWLREGVVQRYRLWTQPVATASDRSLPIMATKRAGQIRINTLATSGDEARKVYLPDGYLESSDRVVQR